MFDPSRVIMLSLGLGLAPWLVPSLAVAAPDAEDDDLVLDDEEDEAPASDADDEDSGASASGSASVSLGGGAKASGEGKRKRKPKEKDNRPFFQRYKPTNHMLNAGGYLGVFWRANNHGLFDRSLGPQPSTRRSNFDAGFRLEYMPIPYVGVGFEGGGMPTNSASEGTSAHFFAVRGHVIGALPYRLSPTLAVGGGVLGARSAGSDILNSTDPAFHWGPGAKFYINDWVAVRMDGRHIVTGTSTTGGRAHHGELLFGIEVNIRLTKWVGDKWREQRSDRDDDTISDYYDECPDEWGDGDDGCPTTRDGDRDGIDDGRDECPEEWGDGPNGCPIPDSDGDGILDISDSCENEPENYNGFEDTDGCPDDLPDEISKFNGVLEGIRFDTGKSTIRKKSKGILDEVAGVLNKYEGVKVEISGHTDSKGKRDKNMALSQSRADAVKDYLVDKGVDASRITTRGAGPDEPIADNKSKRGRAQNRRIEFRLE
ncbi:MAG: OmpA family protein [Myxococcota bacterium]